MQQKKHTQKMKSEQSSQVTKISPLLTVFDTVAGKLVGDITWEDKEYFLVSYPAMLSFTQLLPQIPGQLTARLQGWMPYTTEYRLYKAGIRGMSKVGEEWLYLLYDAHKKRAQTGAYNLNPLDEGSQIEVKPPTVSTNEVKDDQA